MNYFTPSGLFFVAALLCVQPLWGQTDTEFWFAAPEVSSDHGDRPIGLRLSSPDQAATAVVSIPANPDFVPITLNIPAGQTINFDLSSQIQRIENFPANTVLAKGLHIEASSAITAYYEVTHSNNPEIFLLKGSNALGKNFFVPSQTHFPNIHGNESFEIVATRDQTTITMTPREAIMGRSAGSSFTITLNRGETWSGRAVNTLGDGTLSGTRIVSDKPIAVTISDDSIRIGGGWDLTGDQLIPVELLGEEYIAVRGFATEERIYILATENGTEVFQGGGATPFATLSAGQSAWRSITGNVLYIRANKPVYVLHLSGDRDEAGSALLPPINCSGTDRIGFMRAFGNNHLMLLAEGGTEGNFELNGNATAIQASDFFPVPGTNGDWVAARINASALLSGGANFIRNTTGFFHLGVLNFTNTGAGYGYFSDYTSLYFGGEQTICEGDTLTLDAGDNKDSYLWSTGSTAPRINVTQAGTYWARVTSRTCTTTDTVRVFVNSVVADLGADTVLCEGDTFLASAYYDNARYRWQDQSKGAFYTITQPGAYYVDVTVEGCTERDSLIVSPQEKAVVDLGSDTVLCADESLLLDVAHPNGEYRWQDGSREAAFRITEPGTYWVEVSVDGCAASDTIVNRSVFAETQLKDTLMCEGQSLLLELDQPDASYRWQDGSTSPQYEISSAGTYRVTISNVCQSIEDSIRVSYEDCSCRVYFANAFSPNGDGINDVFGPVLGCDIVSYSLQIYNRWGKPVFESQEAGQAWDGNCQGSPCGEGVYVWVVRYEGLRDRRPVFMHEGGTVTLIK